MKSAYSTTWAESNNAYKNERKIGYLYISGHKVSFILLCSYLYMLFVARLTKWTCMTQGFLRWVRRRAVAQTRPAGKKMLRAPSVFLYRRARLVPGNKPSPTGEGNGPLRLKETSVAATQPECSAPLNPCRGPLNDSQDTLVSVGTCDLYSLRATPNGRIQLKVFSKVGPGAGP